MASTLPAEMRAVPNLLRCRGWPASSSSRSSIRMARYERQSGRWERPLKGVELGGLGTQVLAGTGARLVPLSGTRSSIRR
jgi:hypothetical protein